MAVPQLADVKEEHNRMDKSVHDVTFLLEQRRAYNIFLSKKAELGKK